MLKRMLCYFTKSELMLWFGSVAVILSTFLAFDRSSWITLIASLIGVTSLIFAAKGNPASQVLMIFFAILYGIISWQFTYYGEMVTYVFMSLPMAVISLISWLRNPYGDGRSQVRVNRLKRWEYVLAAVLSIAVTVVFYFILRYFGTANLIPSTISVTTSFAAVYFTFRRSPLFAVCYAANDAVLILLWTLAAIEGIRYVSVVACFLAFLANDIYGFICWIKMSKKQSRNA